MRAIAYLAVMAACGSTYAEDSPSKRFEHDMMARYHMHQSYDLYARVEHLLAHDKLDEVRDLARAIGIAPDESGLSAWATQTAAVRDRAEALANSPSVDVGCRRAARLAEACASCHVATSAMPELRTPPPLPPDVGTLETRMARHRWAVERVREGVIGAADEPWRVGLDVLAQEPLPWPDTSGDRAGLARQLHQLADRARIFTVDQSGERATAYGEILVTCAACHAVTDPK